MKGQYIFRFDTSTEATIFVEKVVLWEMCVAVYRSKNVVHVIDGTEAGCGDILYRLARNSGANYAALTKDESQNWDDNTPTKFLVLPIPREE